MNQEEHVEGSISNSMYMNYLPWLLICPSVESLIYKGWRTSVEHSIIWLLWLGLFTNKLVCISVHYFLVHKDHFRSFQFLVPEWEL